MPAYHLFKLIRRPDDLCILETLADANEPMVAKQIEELLKEDNVAYGRIQLLLNILEQSSIVAKKHIEKSRPKSFTWEMVPEVKGAMCDLVKSIKNFDGALKQYIPLCQIDREKYESFCRIYTIDNSLILSKMGIFERKQDKNRKVHYSLVPSLKPFNAEFSKNFSKADKIVEKLQSDRRMSELRDRGF